MQQPRLRFKGFDDEWRKNKLVALLTNIGDGIHGTPKYIKDGNVSFINGNNIKNGHIDILNTKKVDESQKTKHDLALDKNTILMSINGTIGNLAYYNNENVKLGKSVSYMKINKKKSCASFIFTILQSSKIRCYFKNILTGTTIKNLGLGTVKETKLVAPTSLAEQTKIGEFFNRFDKLIELQSSKLEHLKRLKKGYLQKMFTSDSASVPRLRFKGFSDKWKSKRLKDVGKIVGGGTPSTSNKEYWDGDINWYSPNEITDLPFRYNSNRKITTAGLKHSSAKIHPINTILFTSRAGIGKMTIIKKEATTNQGFQSIEPNKDINPYFIYSMQNDLKKKAISLASGSTFLEISKKSMGKIKIMIPLKIEQKKLGLFFNKLDKLIELQSSKLEHLKRDKKAYLQKMFI